MANPSRALGALVAALAVAVAAPATAVTIQPLGRLTAPDPESFDGFGTYVEVSNGRVVVMESEQVSLRDQATGHAHLFDIQTRQHIAELRPFDEVGDPIEGIDGFAASIAIDADRAAVQTLAGIFIFDATTGSQIGTIESPETFIGSASTEFNTIALDGGQLVVGEAFVLNPAALVFDVASGAHVSELLHPDPLAPAILFRFGQAVAVSEGTAAVADVTGAGFNSPGVFLFDVGTGDLLRRLTPDVPHRGFGEQIDMHGDLLLVGAKGQTPDISPAAYLYDVADGTLRHRFTANPGESWFGGKGVAVDDDFAVVSANSREGGAVYVFDVDTGERLARIVPPPEAIAPLLFGSDVAIDDGLIVVGAMAEDVGRRGKSGAVYLYAIVPEPATAVMLFAAVVSAAARRGRRSA